MFDHTAFHRYESGQLKPRRFKADAPKKSLSNMRNARSAVMKGAEPCPPMKITDQTKSNLGKVHYHLACLHGMDRFPEIIPAHEYSNIEEKPSHDIFSVIFHLSHAASLYNVPACLALARARVGLDSSVSPLLKANIPIDFESSKEFCMRAMSAQRAPAAAKVAAGCLLLQILDDEENAGEATAGVAEKIRVLEDTLSQIDASRKEAEIMQEHLTKQSRGKAAGFHVGDKVEANYLMEGTYYTAVVVEVKEDNVLIVQYDDDGSTEALTVNYVKSIEPSSELATAALSDEEALGQANFDEECLFEEYELMSKLASLLEKVGSRRSDAILMYQGAAELAMASGKMKTANELNIRAAELEG